MHRKLTTLGVLAALAIFAGGCTFFQPDLEPTLQPDTYQTLDEKLAQIADRVPGFGGMYLDESGQLVIFLKQPTLQAAAEQAITQVFRVEELNYAAVRVRIGEYDYRQLKDWHDQMLELFEGPGVVFTDIDETSNRLKVGVESDEVTASVMQRLSRWGIPQSAVNFEVTEPIEPLATLRDKVRPLQGGLQINFPGYLCTLGFNAVRAGISGFVTNSHCTSKQGGVENTPYWQPLEAEDTFIGTEIADPTYFRGSGCPRGKKCRYSDSALAQRDAGASADQGLLARTTALGSITIAGSYRITAEAPGNATVGTVLNKVGRTTGWSQGQVSNSCVNTGVSGTNIVQLCQDFVKAAVGGGDSGSPVFRITNAPSSNDVTLHGILWGGNFSGTQFVFSPIANMQRSTELGALTTCAPGFPC